MTTATVDTNLPASMLALQSDQTLLTLAKAIFQQVMPGLDMTEQNFPHHLLSPFCVALAQLYVDLEDIERRTSLATAVGADLDRLGDLYGVPRVGAASALSAVTFTGTAGSVITQGTVVSTVGVNGQAFLTTTAAVVPVGGTVSVPVVALLPGVNGNVGAGTITLLVAPVPVGVTAVTNPLPTTGGVDAEVDGPIGQYFTGYRADIHNLSDARGEGGAAKHLRKWARSVIGVGAVRVLEATPQPGWVTIALVGSDDLPASAALVLAVEDFLLDPWRVADPSETMVLGGFGMSLDTQVDGTPVGGTNNTVKMVYSASGQGTLTRSTANTLMPQAGIWRVQASLKRDATVGTGSLVTFGLYDVTAAAWCWTRPNGSVPATLTLTAAQLSTTFTDYSVDAAWDGIHVVEFRLFRLITDTTSNVWCDHVDYWSTMSREDQDVGLTPAGMRLLIEPAAAVTVSIAATLIYNLAGNQTVATVQAAVVANLIAYLGNLALQDSNGVRRASVEDVIFQTPGVADVNSVTLNGSTNNIAIAPTSVAVLGTTVWS